MMRRDNGEVNVRRVRVRVRRPVLPLEIGILPPPRCPDCGAEQFVYVDPEDGPEVLCPECVCWAITDPKPAA